MAERPERIDVERHLTYPAFTVHHRDLGVNGTALAEAVPTMDEAAPRSDEIMPEEQIDATLLTRQRALRDSLLAMMRSRRCQPR